MPQIDLGAVSEPTRVESPDGTPEGNRNRALFDYACSLQALGVSDDDMERECMRANAAMDPPLDGREVLSIVRSAQHYPKGSAGASLQRPMVERSAPIVPRLHRTGHPERLPSWSAVRAEDQARAWLMALFEPRDVVCVAWDVRGGEVHAHAGQLCDWHDPLLGHLLSKAGEGGLWAVVNPLDGSGHRRADNVAAYRNLLVECDVLPAHEQMERICALLMDGRMGGPQSATVTWSGGKSLHAVVRVSAKDADEYAAERERIYALCVANDLPVDEKCGNPTRLTRVAGAMRGDQVQRLAFALPPSDCWRGTPSTWAWEGE